MTLQLAKLVLYSKRGAIREVKFNLGALNIITGGSETGKSAIIDIVDYVTGRSECNVADGVIRKHVSWYGLVLQHKDSQIFVARRNPEVGEKSHGDAYMERATTVQLPEFQQIKKNTTVPTVEKFLTTLLGISENEHRPPLPTRDRLEANFRHALIFSFQDQNDIDSKQRLFHRQGEDFVGQAIRDTFPYFLGAIDEDRLLKQAQLDQAKRALRQLERQLRDSQAIDNHTFPRAQALLDEAKQAGLLDDRHIAIDYNAALETLKQIARDTRVRDGVVMADGEDVLASLRTERQGLRNEMERVNRDIRSARTFTSETFGFEREAKEQRARLSAIGLVKTGQADGHHCPVCESKLTTPSPTIAQIDRSLSELKGQLEAVQAENPRLQLRLATLMREEEALQARLQENQQRISSRVKENDLLRVQQETLVVQARIVGKAIQYAESASDVDKSSNLNVAIDAAKVRVAVLEGELDPEAIREKLNTFLNIIGRFMTEYAEGLNLEHKGSQLRLDIRNLTVVADTMDGPVPLYRMGSGKNWVGYHILAHLALHKWFRQKGRPVPAFLLLDQPSQSHYPPDQDSEGSLDVLPGEDREVIKRLYELIFKVAQELAPELQIIVMDHADIKTDWFAKAVVERWRGQKKLIPNDWTVG